MPVSEAELIAEQIARRLPRVKRGSLVVYGDIFGGRIDNIHIVRSARTSGTPPRLVIEFDDDESLEVWEPRGSSISDTELRIDQAAKVRWEWFYYGRPKTPENRYFIEHTSDGTTVNASSNVDWYSPTFSPTSQRPAGRDRGPLNCPVMPHSAATTLAARSG